MFRVPVSALVSGLLWCGLHPDAARAAPEERSDYFTRTWSAEEGLTHNVVTHLLQDRTGYMWLATVGGLSRFDGREFKTFALPGNMRQKGDSIRGLAEEGDHLLFLLPDGNVVRMLHRTFTLHPITPSVLGKSPTELFVDSKGTVWVATWGGELFRWENGRVAVFGKNDGLGQRSTSFSFAVDRHGRTWIASGKFLGYYEDGALVPFPQPLGKKLAIAASHSGGIWILADAHLLELNDGRLTVCPFASAGLPPNSLARQIIEDRDHAVWISTRRQGLFRYAEGALTHVALPSDFTLVVSEDREGDIWVGTEGGGVSMLRQKAFSIFDTKTGLPQTTSAVSADVSSNVWLSNRGNGVTRYCDGQFQAVAGTNKLKANVICPDQAGGLWIGTAGGLYHLAAESTLTADKTDVPSLDIRTLFRARNGEVWFADIGGALGYFRDGHSRLFSAQDNYTPERITSIAQDGSGVLWLGSEDGTLWKFSGENLSRVSLPSEISVAPIHALHFDDSGLLWIATSAGLLLKQGESFRRFTEADGLKDSLILQLQEDDFGHLWLGSRRGLFCVQRDQLLALAKGGGHKVSSLVLGKDDGMPNLSLLIGGQPLSTKDSKGILWFTTMQGVVALDPSKISNQVPPPTVVVQGALVDGEDADLRPLHVPPGRHRIEFQFAALSYAAAEKIHLRHQLEGIDPGWVETSSTRTASYSSLPPGNYRLRVANEDATGPESETGTALDFSVTPAWWQAWWARGLAGVALVGAFSWGFRRYFHWQLKRRLETLEQAHALEKERARIARDLHDELGSSLTRIAFGVDQLKRRLSGPESRPLLEQLSQRIRRHASDLQRVVWVESPKNDSLDRVVFFIGRFAQDYFRDSSVVCQVRPPAGIPSDPIPPEVQHHLIAIAKEAFNNVLKHACATQVTIDARFDQSVFELNIQDNGAGFVAAPEADYDHNGLNNMRTRIAEIGGTLAVRSQLGSGTTVSVRWVYQSRLPEQRSSQPWSGKPETI